MDPEQLTAEAVDLLARLIATPRTSRSEANAADLLARFIEDPDRRCAGGTPLYTLHREGANLWAVARDYDASRPTLLLNAHIDTVPPVSGWIRDPFTPSLEGDRLYGLGANDDGASLVSLFQAFRVLAARPQAVNFIYLASAEEEVSGRDGIERVLPLLPPVDVALVGEPTGMQPAIAEKGLMVLDVTALGRAGHAARDEGVNSIYRAVDDIQWFRTHRFAGVSELLGPVKMSVTIVHAGTQHNVVPDSCTFTVDVRTNECYTNEELYADICRHIGSDVRARSFRLNSSNIDPSHPLVLRALALPPAPDGTPRTPFGSPTLSDQALMPFPSMKMGPGQSSRSHTADEYICLSEIREAIDLYIQLLDGIRL